MRSTALTLLILPPSLFASLIAPISESSLYDANFGSVFELPSSVIGPVNLMTNHSIGGGTYSVDLFALSSYGTLKASASSSVTSTASPVQPFSYASPQFVDVLTVNFQPFIGSLGYMAVDYSLDATISQSGSFISGLLVGALVCSNFSGSTCVDPNYVSQGADFTSSTNGVFTFQELFKFTYGTPFDFAFFMEAENGVITGSTQAAGSGIADASDTLSISGISVFDSQMNPLTGYSYVTGSGDQYTFEGAAPEPRTYVSAGVVLAALALASLRRRKGIA